MKSKPKIVVVKMREIIYTLLLLFLVALLIVCMVLMFTKKTGSSHSASEKTAQGTQKQEIQGSSTDQNTLYTAGVYTTPITLGDSTVDVEVTVDQNHINGIRLVNLSESTAAAYPLVSPALDHIASQILETQKLEDITCPQENKYTSQLLLSAISDALDLARVTN